MFFIWPGDIIAEIDGAASFTYARFRREAHIIG